MPIKDYAYGGNAAGAQICPKCFEPVDKAVYACQTPGCTRADVPQDGERHRRDESNAPICAQCGKPLSARVCPRCFHPLDRDAGDLPKLPFVIIGASGCGKSNYLSVLIDQIRHDMGKAYNCALYPLGCDATMDLYDRLYYHPLFVQGRCPSTTESEDVEPLDYSLVFSGGAGRTCSLAFYDSCGTTFDSEKTVAQYNRGLPKAKGILLLIDPSQLPVVGESFAAQGLPVIKEDISALLLRIIHLIRAETSLTSIHNKIPIPIAVCLTKLDMVQHLLDPSSFVKYTSRHLREPQFDRVDWDSCNLEAQSLIESWAGKELMNQIQAQFADSSFFAFSALGAQFSPDRPITHVSPHRVLDPFLWLLWRNGIIECSKQ